MRKLIQDYAAHPQAAEQRVSIDNRFVSPEGPDSLDNILAAHGFPEDLDLVCIDVDSIDLQIWRGFTRFRPRLVVVEYNCMIPPHIELIGPAIQNAIGCSALSLLKLGKQKGYALVACIGWNAFFVRQEDAHHFANVDDLEKLFDRTWLRYAMQTYSGEVFFDAPLLLPHRSILPRQPLYRILLRPAGPCLLHAGRGRERGCHALPALLHGDRGREEGCHALLCAR